MTPFLRRLPNLVTGFRLALLPLFVFLARQCREDVRDGGSGTAFRVAATLVLLAIAVGDVVDGSLARRFHVVTTVGRILDPVADKLTQVAGLILFTFFAEPAYAPLPPWLLASLLLRDLVLLGGALALGRRGALVVRPALVGKAATGVTLLVLLLTCAGLAGAVLLALVWTATILVVASLLLYVRDGWVLWQRAALGS